MLGINAPIVGDNMLIWCIECDEMFIGVWGDSYCSDCWRKLKIKKLNSRFGKWSEMKK